MQRATNPGRLVECNGCSAETPASDLYFLECTGKWLACEGWMLCTACSDMITCCPMCAGRLPSTALVPSETGELLCPDCAGGCVRNCVVCNRTMTLRNAACEFERASTDRYLCTGCMNAPVPCECCDATFLVADMVQRRNSRMLCQACHDRVYSTAVPAARSAVAGEVV